MTRGSDCVVLLLTTASSNTSIRSLLIISSRNSSADFFRFVAKLISSVWLSISAISFAESAINIMVSKCFNCGSDSLLDSLTTLTTGLKRFRTSS